MRKLLGVLAAVCVVGLGSQAKAQQGAPIPLFSGPNCEEASQTLSCFNQLINAINAASYLAFSSEFNNPRNLLDNGAMQVSQRGTGAATCALNGAAITSAAYAADRWGCQVNVAVGAGQLTTISATPTPPIGYSNALKLVRNSGALTQPQCAYQEIPTYKATQVQGQQVTMGINIQALAGLAADQGTATQTATLIIFTGTGADEGFGSWTASPALTPAWTGIATAVTQSIALPSTPSWQRYTATAPIPTTATEIGVAVCFTPTATGAGTTDGIAFTGVQLEQGAAASSYEFKAPAAELAELQRYFYRITESATVIGQRAMCAISSTSLAVCQIKFPAPMRRAPTMTYTSGFELTVAAQTSAVVCAITRTSTTLTGAAATTEAVPIDCTSAAGFGGVGTAAQLYDIGTGSATGVITASADF